MQQLGPTRLPSPKSPCSRSTGVPPGKRCPLHSRNLAFSNTPSHADVAKSASFIVCYCLLKLSCSPLLMQSCSNIFDALPPSPHGKYLTRSSNRASPCQLDSAESILSGAISQQRLRLLSPTGQCPLSVFCRIEASLN